VTDDGSGSSGEVTRLLDAWRRGDRDAVNRLVPLVYEELRGVAHRALWGSRRDASLDTTGLVHETYLKLVDQDRADIRDRRHFFALASKAMRHILVDHARSRNAKKRGGDAVKTVLTDGIASVDARAAEIAAIDEALTRLEALDPRLAGIVEMRFFAGLTTEETAAALEVSERTVKRDWRKARAFLLLALSADGPDP